MLQKLIYFDNQLLRKKSVLVEKFDGNLKRLVVDMVETMDANRGVGIAAVQIGVLLQVLAIRPEVKGPNGEFLLGEVEIFINPKITFHSAGTEIMIEGCLSLPGLHMEVERPKKIVVEAVNLEGKPFKEEIEGFKAREILHENDHLHGTLFIDRLSKVQKSEIRDALKEIHSKYNIIS